MHELHRQTYLSLLGIDSYFPRWELQGAKVSQSCVIDSDQYQIIVHHPEELSSTPLQNFTSPSVDHHQRLKSVDSIFSELTTTKELAVVKELVAQEKNISKSILHPALDNQRTQPLVKPFTLSVWRFESGVMIIDSRDTQQALPTDLLLQNFLSGLYKPMKLLPAEIIRWPLVENRFASLNEQDAREEIQTWLSVQQDIHPLKCLWVMGELAAKFLLPEGESYQQLLYSDKSLPNSNVVLFVSESLNELLKNPLQKKKLLKYFSILSSVV